MRLFITMAMLSGILQSCVPGPGRDQVGFTPEQIHGLKRHGRYEQVLGAEYDKQKRIQEINQSELDLGRQLKSMPDRLQNFIPRLRLNSNRNNLPLTTNYTL